MSAVTYLNPTVVQATATHLSAQVTSGDTGHQFTAVSVTQGHNEPVETVLFVVHLQLTQRDGVRGSLFDTCQSPTFEVITNNEPLVE